jgi:hypothetical protein
VIPYGLVIPLEGFSSKLVKLNLGLRRRDGLVGKITPESAAFTHGALDMGLGLMPDEHVFDDRRPKPRAAAFA